MIYKPGKPSRGRKGYALYYSMVLLALCIVAAAGIGKIIDRNRQAADLSKKSEKAYYMARTGLQKAINQLASDHWWSVDSPHYVEFEKENSSFTVSVWAPISNIHTSRKAWKVVSTGRHGEVSRTLTAWLVRKPFTDYVYFSDYESFGDTTLWITDRDKMEGDVHTNGFFSITGRPQFSGAVTSYNFQDQFLTEDRKRYLQGSKTYKDPARFYHYYKGYNVDEPVAYHGLERNFSFSGVAVDVPLPEDMDYISQAADKTYTQDIYIRFMDSGKARIRWQKGDTWETEDIDTINLTLYAEGKVFIERGEFRGSCTVASAGDMEILGSITYRDQKKDLLGLLCKGDIKINTDPDKQQDLNIDAAIMILDGSLYLKDYLEGYPRGTLNIYGCLIQKYRGPVGTIKNGDPYSGYVKYYRYDPRLLYKAPPNFPTSGFIEVISAK